MEVKFETVEILHGFLFLAKPRGYEIFGAPDHDITTAVEGVEVRIVIFKRYRRHFFRNHIVAVSVFAAVNTVRVQIVLINEENTTAHTWRKTGNDVYRAG